MKVRSSARCHDDTTAKVKAAKGDEAAEVEEEEEDDDADELRSTSIAVPASSRCRPMVVVPPLIVSSASSVTTLISPSVRVLSLPRSPTGFLFLLVESSIAAGSSSSCRVDVIPI